MSEDHGVVTGKSFAWCSRHEWEGPLQNTPGQAQADLRNHVVDTHDDVDYLIRWSSWSGSQKWISNSNRGMWTQNVKRAKRYTNLSLARQVCEAENRRHMGGFICIVPIPKEETVSAENS